MFPRLSLRAVPRVLSLFSAAIASIHLAGHVPTASGEALSNLPPFGNTEFNNWWADPGSNSTIGGGHSTIPPDSIWSRDFQARSPSQSSVASEQQVHELIKILAGKRNSQIPDSLALPGVEAQLKSGLAARPGGKKKIETFFIIYGGSNGDVPLISSVLQGMLDRPDIFDVKHCIVLGDSFRDFFPEHLQKRFMGDNAQWAARKDPVPHHEAISLFIAKMESILKDWSPDLIFAGHFIAPSSSSQEQRAKVKQLTTPSNTRLLVECNVFYLPGLRSTSMTIDDIKPNYVRLYAQQPEIWDNPNPASYGGAMVGKFPRLSSGSGGAKRQGPVYDWIDKQTIKMGGKVQKRRILYMGLGMKQREWDKTHAFPAFEELAKRELESGSHWSFIIFHNAKREESRYPRETHGGRVFHLFVGETSWSTLFPEVTIPLTHGGVGSMTDAIAAGKPQIMLPTDYAPDQDYFAQRLESRLRIGVGLDKIPIRSVLRGERTGVENVRSAFRKVKENYQRFQTDTRAYQLQLQKTQSMNNMFEILERMCAGLIARTSNPRPRQDQQLQADGRVGTVFVG